MFKGEQYDFFNGNYTYCDENNCDRWLFDDLYETLSILNDEVELIEQQYIDVQAIEELVGSIDYRCNNKEISAEDYAYNFSNIAKSIHSIVNKQNELIKAVKQLDKTINKE